jgi:hypothetical protein
VLQSLGEQGLLPEAAPELAGVRLPLGKLRQAMAQHRELPLHVMDQARDLSLRGVVSTPPAARLIQS